MDVGDHYKTCRNHAGLCLELVNCNGKAGLSQLRPLIFDKLECEIRRFYVAWGIVFL